MNVLFVAWQDPETRRWWPVGRLSREDGDYHFVYTRGAEAAERFVPFGRMTNLHDVYVAKELFPLFANRLLPKSRPEYRDFLCWLGLEGSDDALDQLARSGGIRATDSLQIFPSPEPTPDNHYAVEYFSHGIRYMPPTSRERIETLDPGEWLYLMRDIQNPFDDDAMLMRTGDPILGVGYCPRFYSADFTKLLDLIGKDQVQVTVVAVNPDAPLQFRLRCRLTAPWPAGFGACRQETFEPLAAETSGSI
ncbi:HIRAN domain-containing protein [Candidatus Thiosymbion oneisti]|uniref:HIRAN domain-containing protein n=1 Tax=Candidatus Thiosymbion oneisti TaxID=589554 RepID=UPI000AF764B3|nr:HIRAN domain-containing protein [Candidatus Thiosymbion oneisti]